jgi:DNA-directed RNA polymerase subunit omega
MEVPTGIESKFRFILVAAKRARQLQAGAKPLMQTQWKKATKVAQSEVLAGLVPIELVEIPPEGDSKNKKRP